MTGHEIFPSHVDVLDRSLHNPGERRTTADFKDIQFRTKHSIAHLRSEDCDGVSNDSLKNKTHSSRVCFPCLRCALVAPISMHTTVNLYYLAASNKRNIGILQSRSLLLAQLPKPTFKGLDLKSLSATRRQEKNRACKRTQCWQLAKPKGFIQNDARALKWTSYHTHGLIRIGITLDSSSKVRRKPLGTPRIAGALTHTGDPKGREA